MKSRDVVALRVTLIMCCVVLRFKGVNAPHVLIYCQSLSVCSDLFAHFNVEFDDDSFHPPGSAHVSEHRLHGMYHSGTIKTLS